MLFELGFFAWFIVAISIGSLVGIFAGACFEHYRLSHPRPSRSRH
jgi:hypothetical protein